VERAKTVSDTARSPARPDHPARRSGQILNPSRNAGDAIADVLAERIVAGEYAPEDRLPSERQLAVEFGASRPMVREALRSLVERGLIEVESGRGAFVRGDTGPRRFQQIDLEYRRRGTTARQLSETRLMLETEAAALATQYADDADLAILAAGRERYDAYVAGVRQEYAEVPDADFRAGRKAVLEDLLAHDTLFHSEAARERWEERARANVSAEVAALS